jgi:hypothetical protein
MPHKRDQWSRNGVLFGQRNDELYDMPAHALAVIEASIERITTRNRLAYEEKLVEFSRDLSA